MHPAGGGASGLIVRALSIKPDHATQGGKGLTTVSTRQQTVLALDMGGTHLRVALGDGGGKLLRTFRERSDANDPAAQLGAMINALHAQFGPFWHVVVGVPGVVVEDQITDAPNLPGLQSPSALSRLRRALPCAATFMNDCNLAALGEGEDALAFVAVGTGLGCGLVRGGRPVTGAHGQAGEFGLLPLPGGVLEEALVYLLQVLTLSFDPQHVVFGGGVGLRLEALIELAWTRASRRTPCLPRPRLSRHGDNAALIGGLRLAAGQLSHLVESGDGQD